MEGFGGNISWHEVSAKTGAGISDFLDLILLAADLENLTYNPAAPARGVVLTAHLDPRRGLIVGAVVTDGRLRRGDFFHTESSPGKVKILEDFAGSSVEFLEPSAPAVILGFENLPMAGEEIILGRPGPKKAAEKLRAAPSQTTETEKTLKVLLKANEISSLEALEGVIQKINKEWPIIIVDKNIGDIYENDVKLAATSSAVVLGFKVKLDKAAENLAKNQNITILTSPIIYELEKNIKDFFKNVSLREGSEVELLAVFGTRGDNQQVIGGRVTYGLVKNLEKFEIWRGMPEGNKKIGEGKILNLQSQKKDIREAAAEQEIGILVESETKIKVGDKLLLS